MSQKYAFVGSHGTGKSSGASYLGYLLKKTFPQKSVKVIEENIREIAPLFNNVLNSYEFQRIAMIDHLHKELIAEKLYDIVVCDRSSLDTLIYGLCYGVRLPPEYFSLALRHMDTFNAVLFVRPDSHETNIVDDGFRDLDIKLRNEVDLQFDKILKLWGGKFAEIRTNNIFSFQYLEFLGIRNDS